MKEWMDQSACRKYDPDLFFTEGWSTDSDRSKERAALLRRNTQFRQERVRQVCRGCPVQEECFWDAMVHPDRYGMRAGMTPSQQAKMRRRHKKEIEAREALLSRAA
jgi:hypothetical protein